MNESVTGAAKSRTIWLGLALTVFGYLETQGDVIGHYVTPEVSGLINMGFGLAVIVLRFLTTTPLAQK